MQARPDRQVIRQPLAFYPAHYDLVSNTLRDLPSPLAFEMLRVLGVELGRAADLPPALGRTHGGRER